MIIGIEAIVACIMSIDKDDPPRRAGSGGTGRVELLCYYARRLQMCIVYREKEGFNLLVLFSSKKLRFVY